MRPIAPLKVPAPLLRSDAQTPPLSEVAPVLFSPRVTAQVLNFPRGRLR